MRLTEMRRILEHHRLYQQWEQSPLKARGDPIDKPRIGLCQIRILYTPLHHELLGMMGMGREGGTVVGILYRTNELLMRITHRMGD